MPTIDDEEEMAAKRVDDEFLDFCRADVVVVVEFVTFDDVVVCGLAFARRTPAAVDIVVVVIIIIAMSLPCVRARACVRVCVVEEAPTHGLTTRCALRKKRASDGLARVPSFRIATRKI